MNPSLNVESSFMRNELRNSVFLKNYKCPFPMYTW